MAWLLLVALSSADAEFEAACLAALSHEDAFASRAEFDKWQVVLKRHGLDKGQMSAYVVGYMATSDNSYLEWEALRTLFLYRLKNKDGQPRFFSREVDGSLPSEAPPELAEPGLLEALRQDEFYQHDLVPKVKAEARAELFDDVVRMAIIVVVAHLVVGLIYSFWTRTHRKTPRRRRETWVQKANISN